MTPALELELPGDNGAPALARRAVEERIDHGYDEEQIGRASCRERVSVVV